MRDESEPIVMGRVSGSYGVRGWLKIQSFTRPPVNILSYTPWLVQRDKDWQELVVLDGKVYGKGLIAQLEGITDRDEARSLLGADIAIWRSQLHAAGPDDYYWDDLLDMQVVNQEGKLLGSVTGILETGANDVLVVEGSERHLIPLVWTTYVQDIDLARKTIRVDWE
jgi:16S rRNA processing protein RimM